MLVFRVSTVLVITYLQSDLTYGYIACLFRAVLRKAFKRSTLSNFFLLLRDDSMGERRALILLCVRLCHYSSVTLLLLLLTLANSPMSS